VVEAFGGLPAFEEADTGSLVGDLKAMLRAYLELFNETPLATVLPALASERAHDPALAALFNPVLRQRRSPLMNALERARARGEIPPDTDLELAADLIVGPIAVRLFFTGRRIQPKLVDPLVEMALGGIQKR
jgi:AcrR family transcriptional regulator